MNKTTLMIISTLIAAPAIQGRTINYPAARTVDTVDVYFGPQVADPYRCLEDDNSAETAQWVSSMRKDHFSLAAAVKAVLILLAVFGCSTMWFAAVLDGAAALGTMLLSVRAYGFDKQHRRLRDLLKPYESK